MRVDINGILLLDKPASFTSNAALQRVKRLFNAKKAGHTGSLDPIATGMLPLCFGEATKFSQFLLESNKTYFVTAKLGSETNTGDSEGEITVTKPVENVTVLRVEEALTKFLGSIQQIPPMFSAIKVQGRPLYELARRGIEIPREPRTVTIFSSELNELTPEEFSITVHCSKGTYVRTLIEDIGRVLGCGAHVIALRRTSVTPYADGMMYTLPVLEAIAESAGASGLAACLLKAETAVEVFPAVVLSEASAFYLRMGQPIRTPLPFTTPLVRLMSEDARFLGIGEVLPDGRVKPRRLLATG